MTIAIGMRCDAGVILAADTKVPCEDGSVTYGSKLSASAGKSCTFGIANSSNDANAATTLVRRLSQLLKEGKFSTWNDVEEKVSLEMTDWDVPQKERTGTNLLLAVRLPALGVGFYHCVPPNTILPRPFYFAAGGGSAVTDPLQHSLFQMGTADPQYILRQISYLMYRAKHGHALCGGNTQGVYIRANEVEPEWVNSNDLAYAEKLGPELDTILHAVSQSALFVDDSLLGSAVERIGEIMHMNSRIRHTEFHNMDGDLIKAAPLD